MSTSHTSPAGPTDLIVTAMLIKTLHDQPVLRIAGSLPYQDGEVGAAIAAADQSRRGQGLEMAGPPYFTCGPGTMGASRWEAGIPVGRAGVRDGRVEPGVLAGSEVASVYYQGNYMAPGRAAAVHDYLLSQIEAAGLRPAGDPRWIYLSAPEHTPDPEHHYSEVVWPVSRG